MAWTVVLSRSAEKSLRKLPADIQRWAVKIIAELHGGPRISGAEKLEVPGKLFRVRKGDYRLTFEVRADEIRVIRIGHRRDVYRDL
jgi:mRNA interferase RelE/StbE